MGCVLCVLLCAPPRRGCLRGVCVGRVQDLLGNGFVGRLNSWSVSFMDNSLSLGPVSRVQPSAIGPYAARSSFVFGEHASYVHLDTEAAEVRLLCVMCPLESVPPRPLLMYRGPPPSFLLARAGD